MTRLLLAVGVTMCFLSHAQSAGTTTGSPRAPLVRKSANELDRKIRAAFQRAIEQGHVIGGVVEVGTADGVLYTGSVGNRATEPTTEPATLDTIYDLASVTKCLATATAVMLLAEEGRISLGTPLGEYMPEWQPTTTETQAATRAEVVTKNWTQQTLATILTKGLGDNLSMTSRNDGISSDALFFSPEIARNVVLKSSYHRGDVTVRHLLTHTGGLAAGARYDPAVLGTGDAFRRAMREDIPARRIVQPPGAGFIYSDLGYITLGNLVEVVTSQSLDSFCRERIFEPLGMADTSFRPSASLRPRIAPTEWRGKKEKVMVRGTVHDGNCANLGGVSGHAGLFSTARDVGAYCRAFLKSYDGMSGGLLSTRAARAMATDQARLNSGQKRGYGWDILSRYSTPRGDLFEGGFGHTGWTGTSVWMLPEENLYIVLLTNRVHPNGTGDAAELRSLIANIVATYAPKSTRRARSTP